MFRKHLDLINTLLLSLPIGLVLWVSFFLVLILSGLPWNSFLIFILNVLFFSAIVYLNIKKKRFSKTVLISTLIYLAGFSLLSIVFLVANFSFLSHDSWILFTGGQHLGLYNDLTSGFLKMGGLFSFIINSSNVLFGFDYLYAFFPLLTLSFILFFFYNLYFPFQDKEKALDSGFFLSLCLSLFLFSSYFVFFHAHYLHSNLLFAIYSFFAVFGLWKRLTSGSNTWLIISCLTLLAASFIRMEGPLFALLIIVILFSIRTISFKEKCVYLIGFCLPTIIWHLKLFFVFKDQADNPFLNPQRVLTIALLYVFVVLIFILGQRRPLRRLQEFLPFGMLYVLSITWTVLIMTTGLKTESYILVLKRYGILLVNATSRGGWGITWIVITVLFLIALLIKKFNHESVFLYYIFSFFLLYNCLNVFRKGWRPEWGDSGNRMLLHVLFILAFYTFLKLRSAILSRAIEE